MGFPAELAGAYGMGMVLVGLKPPYLSRCTWDGENRACREAEQTRRERNWYVWGSFGLR